MLAMGWVSPYPTASNRLSKSARVAPTSETYYAYDTRNLVTREFVLAGSTNYYDYDASQRMTKQRSTTDRVLPLNVSLFSAASNLALI